MPSVACWCLKQIFRWVGQDVFNLLPNLNLEELSRSFAVKSNDMMLVIYLSSLVRSVLALHDLIDNREVKNPVA
jgi:hypothetical protein